MPKKSLLVFLIIFIIGVCRKNYCPFSFSTDITLVTFENHIPWALDVIEEWNTKVMLPLEASTDTTLLKKVNYKKQKDLLDLNLQIAIDETQDTERKKALLFLKSKIDQKYDILNRANIFQKLSAEKENYHVRHYLIPLEKKFLGQQYFEVVAQPGERKEVSLPVKGPIVQMYIFEDIHAEEFFKKHGMQKYLNSKYGHEQGLERIVYDAANRKKLAIETLFPERPSSSKKREHSPEGDAEAGPSSIPMTSFVGEDAGRLTEPLLATGLVGRI